MESKKILNACYRQWAPEKEMEKWGEGKVLSNCRQVIPRNHNCVVDGSSLLMIQPYSGMLCYSNIHTMCLQTTAKLTLWTGMVQFKFFSFSYFLFLHKIQMELLPSSFYSWENWSFRISPFSSVSQSCPTLCDPMNRSTPGLPVHHQLPEFTQNHVYRVGDAIQPSHPLSSPFPPAPNPSQH